MEGSDKLYIIPAGDYFDAETDQVALLYAPLAGSMALATGDDIRSAEDFVSGKTVDDIRNDFFTSLTGNKSPDNFFGKVKTARDLQKMSVLPNHTCNFSCSYCYSARGRANVVLEKEKLKAGLDFFIDPERTSQRNLTLSFIGGGEPLLSWDLVRWGVEYSRDRAERYGFELVITLITNGSIISGEIIEVLKRYDVLPDVSFDILEDVQNCQRGHFAEVCETIDMLCCNGVPPSINATITPATVDRLDEMFAFMKERFPQVKNMVMEPVVAPELFPTTASMRDFYSRYLENFMKVRRLAEKSGKFVMCRIYKNIDSVLDRGCPSKFTLTPQGDVSICYCTSSPKEEHYTKRIYGTVDASGVKIDDNRFADIHGIGVHSMPKCADCFAKWHCGGGCMCPNDLYGEPYLDEICDFTRELVRRVLLERMEQQSDIPLKDLLA